ncbi:MAG TPA: hypothetical protein VJ792_09015 [Candidatus Nitrosotalea sp.]|nr:hypothetical protein [Candidatus Nitrosotalea sp.]
MEQSHKQVERILIGLAIEHTLLQIDRPVFERVQKMFTERYHCDVADSSDHPEYLRDILGDVFGSSQTDVIKSIGGFLSDFRNQYQINEFMTKMGM